MRFELMDPLAQMFNELRVASVLEVLKGGYLRVGMDGPDVESECIPLHCTSSFMFPVGYAQKYNIKLGGPNDTEEFNWDNYLQQAGAVAAPESLFRPVPDEKFMDHFQIGAKLEASDMCENHLVCPATVAAHKGRLLQIHFDGWEDTYDQLFDVQ
ncbi:mbt repeat protein [Oesophagostomum dentatum]|uniref:Mbt repeat protein n=1 Tax=Oesophagostomum dentatum TaxID=61180 RepID=A0A0B1SC63_OESDE|nr:mbt repeat protein [Oesophagostomum dentatum]